MPLLWSALYLYIFISEAIDQALSLGCLRKSVFECVISPVFSLDKNTCKVRYS